MKRLSIIVAVIGVAFAPQSALSNGDCVLNVLIAVAATSETRPSEDDWETELSKMKGEFLKGIFHQMDLCGGSKAAWLMGRAMMDEPDPMDTPAQKRNKRRISSIIGQYLASRY